MIKNKICIKKMITIIILLFATILMIGCNKTNNEIYNTSYDVDITIDDISDMLVPATKKATEAVIGVNAYGRTSILGSWTLQSTGSGVVYKAYAIMKDNTRKEDISKTKDSNDVKEYIYYALTNEHVIYTGKRGTLIKAFISDVNLLVDATILGYNITEDLAVISFKTNVYITPITFGDSDNLSQGEFVVSVGNPEGYDYSLTTTLGIVSYPKRYMEVERDMNLDGFDETKVVCELIQHDASINSGNSGGALINTKGELIGINVLKLMDKEKTIEGMGFAIPINVVKKYLDSLEGNSSYTPLSINGIFYSINELKNSEIYENIPSVEEDISELSYGIYVYNIKTKNFLELKVNDIILELNGEKLTNSKIFLAKIRYLDRNTSIEVKIIRDNKEIILTKDI